MRFSHSFRVDAVDIDEQGHVNNVAFVRWIQDVAIAHWRNAATEEQLGSFSWVVVRHEVDYKKPAFEGDDITVTTWVENWTHVTCDRFTEIHRNGELLTKSKTVWCMFDRKTTKPTKIKQELIQRFS